MPCHPGRRATCRSECGLAYPRRAGNDEHWFAQLRLLLSFRDAAGAEHRLAFLRWLSSTGGAEVPMQRLAWAKQGPAGGTQRAWYECVDVDTIERPVFLQPDPKHEGCFYYNHFMGCASHHLPACRPCIRASGSAYLVLCVRGTLMLACKAAAAITTPLMNVPARLFERSRSQRAIAAHP